MNYRTLAGLIVSILVYTVTALLLAAQWPDMGWWEAQIIAVLIGAIVGPFYSRRN